MTNAPARMRNLAHAFERLLEGGTMTRGDLMGATGLSKATVARLVTELEEAGLVETRWIDPGEGPGRRASGLGVPSALGHVLGLSLGLSSSHAVALDLAGRTVGSRLEPTPGFSEGDDIAAWAAKLLGRFGAELKGCGPLLRVCVALPGRIRDGAAISPLPAPLASLAHEPSGTSSFSASPSFARSLEEALGVPVMLATDADMALCGVTSRGHLDAETSAVLFTLSTALTVSTRTRLGVVQARSSALGDYALLPLAVPQDIEPDGGSSLAGLRLGSLLSVRGLTEFVAAQGIELSSISELWERDGSDILRVRRIFAEALVAAILVAAITTDPETCVLTGRLAPLAATVAPQVQDRLDAVLESAPRVIVPGIDDNGLTTALGSADAALGVERARLVRQLAHQH